MTDIMTLLKQFVQNERGATTVEYVAIISGVGLTLLASLGGAQGMLTQGIELLTSEMKKAAPQ